MVHYQSYYTSRDNDTHHLEVPCFVPKVTGNAAAFYAVFYDIGKHYPYLSYPFAFTMDTQILL